MAVDGRTNDEGSGPSCYYCYRQYKVSSTVAYFMFYMVFYMAGTVTGV